jgi:ligand-binding SRPBCC domain-containing protein
MKFFKLFRKIDLAISKDQCGDFFSDPKNLKKIIPSYMGFHIIEGGDVHMYEGQIIAYKVSPMQGLKLTWVTEITNVREGEFFVDEQRIGPYKFWHHKHFFSEIEGGMRCVDEVHYAPPFSLIAPLTNRLVITSKLKQIFDYRTEVLINTFGILEGNQ